MLSLYIQLGAAYLLTAPGLPSHQYDRQETCNPYGIAIVGWETDQDRKWSFDVQFRHQSSLPRKDWGDNAIQMSVKWRPFK